MSNKASHKLCVLNSFKFLLELISNSWATLIKHKHPSQNKLAISKKRKQNKYNFEQNTKKYTVNVIKEIQIKKRRGVERLPAPERERFFWRTLKP